MPFLPFPYPLAQVKSVNVRHTTIPSQRASLIKLKGDSIDWCLHLYCHHCRVITIIILPPVTAETTSKMTPVLGMLNIPQLEAQATKDFSCITEQSNLQLISQHQFSHLTATTIYSSNAVCFLPS
jgi:hypothetical protein